MPNAIVLIDKTAGVTSFGCLNFVKRYVNKKTGHCGTLDKFATGLIIACCGHCTKLVPEFTGLDKTYIAKIEFGKETDTLDPEGNVIDTKPIPSEDVIRQKVSEYVGRIVQVPPIYSAVHVNGKRSYELARSGKDVELKAREVEIYSAAVLNYTAPFLTVELHVSKGTYVRSYARDLAKLCNSCAYVTALKRTKIGPFSVNEAIKYNDNDALQAVSDNSLQMLARLKEYKATFKTLKG